VLRAHYQGLNAKGAAKVICGPPAAMNRSTPQSMGGNITTPIHGLHPTNEAFAFMETGTKPLAGAGLGFIIKPFSMAP
jgi:hypothetical protein